MFRLPPELTEHLQRGGTLLVPSRQRARAVQLAYAAAQLAAGLRTWASADVLSLAGWLRRETERAAAADPEHWPRLLSQAEEWFLWREATATAARGLQLLDAVQLAQALRRAANLAADYGLAPREVPGDEEATLLARAQAGFAQRCRALGAASAAELTDRVLQYAGHSGRLPRLAGFGALPPRLRSLAGGAQPAGDATVYALRPPSAGEELEAIAAWCGSQVTCDPQARLLVMLPGPAGARERLAALIREVLDPAALMDRQRQPRALAGIEGGQPLSEAPLVAHALLGLRLLAGEQIEFASLAAWLRAAHWHSPAAAGRAALAQLLGERPVAAMDVRELHGALGLAPPRLHGAALDLQSRLSHALAAMAGPAATPRAFSERCAAALAALGLAGPATAASDAQQTLMRWHELLEEFGELTACVPRLGPGRGVALLHEFAATSAFRPADEDPVVTISAALADPVVRYDGIWVGGLSAQVLPQPVNPDPFLPLATQVAAGMPAASAAAREQQAAGLLAAWRAGSSQLVLSVPALAQDLELLPSPLLAGVAGVPAARTHRWLPGALHRPGLTEQVQDTRGDPWDITDTVPGGTRAVTLQSQCPFRAYTELRLGSVAPQAAEPGIAADKRGVLLHAALQILWERLKDQQTLNRLSAAELDGHIHEAVEQAARSMLALEAGRRRRGRRADEGQFDLFVQLPAVLVRECRRARALIHRLCALERERAPFAVAGTEQSTELNVAGARLRMRLDRIDTLAEGRAILDYKSGRAAPAQWYGDRPSQPQLLAYLAALGADVAALATVHVTARKVHFSGVAAADGLLPNVRGPKPGATAWPRQLAEWHTLIERLVTAFVAGDAQVDPAPGACTYCHVIDICRILERSTPPEALAAGDDDE